MPFMNGGGWTIPCFWRSNRELLADTLKDIFAVLKDMAFEEDLLILHGKRICIRSEKSQDAPMYASLPGF